MKALNTRTLVMLLSLSWTTGFLQSVSRQTYLTAREDLIEERFPQALESFREVVRDHPDSEEADDAQYYVGYVLERMNRDEEAIRAFDDLIEQWPDSIRVESARSHRAELMGRRTGASEALLQEVLSESSSWEVRRDTALALARRGDFSASNVLEEALRRGGTSRRIELIRTLGGHTDQPEARRLMLLALEGGGSTSVSLATLEALEPIAAQSEVTQAIGRLLSGSGSTSVKQKAIATLAPHRSQPEVRRALAAALDSESSTSVRSAAAKALGSQMLTAEAQPAVVRLFQGSASTSVRLQVLKVLESESDRPELAPILREAVRPGNSTSVKLRALSVAQGSTIPEVRDVARAGLVAGTSTSVQLRALEALTEGDRNDPQAAEALEALFRAHDSSTSVQLAGLEALERHLDTPAGPRALAAALDPSSSTSVQLKAIRLAAPEVERPEVKQGVLQILEDGSSSTSVQLEAIRSLGSTVSDAEVRSIISAALRPSNSTSVHLRAIQVLSTEVDEADVRRALIGTFDSEYSTSVVLRAMETLDPRVGRDEEVKSAYVRLMQNGAISSSARVRAAEALLPAADATLKGLIVESMEEVVIRLSRRSRHGHSDALEDALRIIETIDRDRARRLRERYRIDLDAASSPPAPESRTAGKGRPETGRLAGLTVAYPWQFAPRPAM